MAYTIREDIYYTRFSPKGLTNDVRVESETQLVIQEAEAQGIKWELIDGTRILKLDKNGQIAYIENHTPASTLSSGKKICLNKADTCSFLRRSGLSTPKGFTIEKTDTPEYIKEIWDDLQKPVVLKPTHGTFGIGVTLNITEFDELHKLVKDYFEKPIFSGALHAEEQFKGAHEYRIIATDEKLVAIMERIPAYVVGDGISTIQQLVEKKNLDPIRNIAQDLYPHITIDDDMKRNLEQSGKTLESVPQKDEHVQLRLVSNIMSGGEAIDRTDMAHPSLSDIVAKAVRSIPGLRWGGLDFITTDLSAPQDNSTYTIVEINSAPEFAMHDLPMQGQMRNTTKEFLNVTFS